MTLEQRIVSENEAKALLMEGWLIKLTTPAGQFVIEREKKDPAPELKPEELMKPMSPFDEMSEDEILYYATPYYDVLQAQKEQQEQLKAEEKMKHG